MIRFALRRFPALPTIEGYLRAQVQVLNHDLLVALVARAGRRLLPSQPPFASIVSLSSWLPRRRLDFSPAGLLAPAPPETPVRCLVHAGRLLRRTRRQILQPCKLVLDRLMFHLQLRQRTAELLILSPQASNLANQLANHANQVRVRKTFKQIRDASCHPQLKSYFRTLNFPTRPEICPGYG